MSSVEASVILCVRNGVDVLGAQLESLCRQTADFEWELVLVDNGSSDGSAALAMSYADRLPGIRIVEATERASLAYARNVGASQANGRVLAFCDADDEARPEWLELLVKACPDFGIAAGGLDFTKLNPEPPRFWRDLGDSLVDLQEVGGMKFAFGANFAVTAATFERVGGCDPQFVAACDDVDLSRRIQLAGGELRFCREAVMDYRLRPDIKGNMKQQMGYGMAEVRLYIKHRPAMQRQPGWEAVRSYWALLRGCHWLIRGYRRRGAWLALASMRFGRLRGSWQHRVLYW